jgi:hypothetical protein
MDRINLNLNAFKLRFNDCVISKVKHSTSVLLLIIRILFQCLLLYLLMFMFLVLHSIC